MKYLRILSSACLVLFACTSDTPAESRSDEDSNSSESSDEASEDAGRRDARAGNSSGRADASGGRDAMSPSREAATPMMSGAEDCAKDSSADGAALHQAALDVLSPMTPCGFSSCHSSRTKAAGLTLLEAKDLRTLLVDKTACEAPELPLVDGSGGKAALARSWLWLKLTSDVDAQGALPDNASWGMAKSCGQSPDQPYGVLMPLESGMLEEERLDAIRSWICAGAPGP